MLTPNLANQLKSSSFALVAILVARLTVVAFADDPQPATGSAAKVQESATAPAPVLSGHVTSDTGFPLVGARVRAAFPATNMRFIVNFPDRKVWETTTGAHGEFLLELSGITKPGRISIDAIAPGYHKMSSTPMNIGNKKELEVALGLIAEANIKLTPALYVRGIVVNEDGRPIPAVEVYGNTVFPKRVDGLEKTVSGADGTFELFDYSVVPPADQNGVGRGVVHFIHQDYVAAEVADVYAEKPDQIQALKVVLPTGRKIAGQVLDASGKPVPHLLIEATRDDGSLRKATMTDANGQFTLRGLIDGATKLNAHAMDIKQKSNQSILLDRDINELEVRLKEISLTSKPRVVTVLGMQLTDLTAELRSVYDQYESAGALILGPGENSKRLVIGQLAEGNCFLRVGRKRVGNVREFVEQILTETANQNGNTYIVDVVYSFNSLEYHTNVTTQMKLTSDDIKELRRVLNGLTVSEQPR